VGKKRGRKWVQRSRNWLSGALARPSKDSGRSTIGRSDLGPADRGQGATEPSLVARTAVIVPRDREGAGEYPRHRTEVILEICHGAVS
jgi:hypothetical protein